MLAREKSHSLSGLLLPRRDERVPRIAEPAGSGAQRGSLLVRPGRLTNHPRGALGASLPLTEHHKRRSIPETGLATVGRGYRSARPSGCEYGDCSLRFVEGPGGDKKRYAATRHVMISASSVIV